ncbi:MAG: Gfo/Idh/MocA family protein [Vicinamibacterales bacterium]
MADRVLNAAVVGLGVGQRHAIALRESPRSRLVWVHDIDSARAQAVARELGTRAAPDFDVILADPAVDLVCIASYDDAHANQVLRAVGAGKHVFVEKPLCRSLEELRAIRRAWDPRRGRIALESNLVLRTAPLFQWLRERVQAGDLGDIYAFDGDYLYGRIEKITAGWRGAVENYSVMQGGGIHLIDLMLWLTGERPTAVTAHGNRIATRTTAFSQDDFVAATFTGGERGIVGRITANFGCVHAHQHVVRIFGTRGTVILDDAGARWHRSREASVRPEPLLLAPREPDKAALLAMFVSAIVDGRDTTEETQRVFDGVSLAVAADLAASTGAMESVQYV